MGQTESSDVPILGSGVQRSDTVLLLGPDRGSLPVHEACVGLLSGTAPENVAVLTVELMNSPTAWLDDWLAVTDTLPDRLQFVSDVEEPLPESVSMTRVINPRDLPRLGITIVDRLEEYADYPGDVVLCFHSLTALLQYRDEGAIFRFVHTLKSRLRNLCTRIHIHLDPEAADEKTVATLESLFDAVITVADDGEMHVE